MASCQGTRARYKVRLEADNAVDGSGLDQMGIYRLSGTTSKVQKLKAALDTGESDRLSLVALHKADIVTSPSRPRRRRRHVRRMERRHQRYSFRFETVVPRAA